MAGKAVKSSPPVSKNVKIEEKKKKNVSDNKHGAGSYAANLANLHY